MSRQDHNTITRAKRQAVRLGQVYYRWGKEVDSETIMARAARVGQCSTYWTGSMCTACGAMMHMHTYGCGDRLCPLCAARKARATAAQAMAVVPMLHGIPLLLTLTVRNVAADQLTATIDQLVDAWGQLRKRRIVQRGVCAWARTVEITYNARADTYHPHVHAIIYATPDTLATLSRWDAWRDMWQEVMGLDYQPIVDIRKIDNTTGSVCEVSKYVAKLSRILSLPDNLIDGCVRTMATAIHKRRLRSYGGDWARARRKMRMIDVDQMDDGTIDALSAQLDTDQCCGKPMVPITMIWAGMEYKILEGSTTDAT